MQHCVRKQHEATTVRITKQQLTIRQSTNKDRSFRNSWS